MTYLVLYVNEIEYPTESLTMDCSSPFGVTRAYETLFTSMGIHQNELGHMITREIFTKSFYILGFDLTAYKEADEEHISLPRQGKVRIEARFKNPYQNLLLPNCMLNFPDTSRSITPEMLQ
jgi:hypothetical protein